jgi:hypothetical protein
VTAAAPASPAVSGLDRSGSVRRPRNVRPRGPGQPSSRNRWRVRGAGQARCVRDSRGHYIILYINVNCFSPAPAAPRFPQGWRDRSCFPQAGTRTVQSVRVGRLIRSWRRSEKMWRSFCILPHRYSGAHTRFSRWRALKSSACELDGFAIAVQPDRSRRRLPYCSRLSPVRICETNSE